MDLTKEYCTKEQGLKLQELGVNVPTRYFIHTNVVPQIIWLKVKDHTWCDINTGYIEMDVMLGDYMVPVYSTGHLGQLLNVDYTGTPRVWNKYLHGNVKSLLDDAAINSEAQLRAQILITAIESNIDSYSVDEINKR
jgi:hypothetical protein